MGLVVGDRRCHPEHLLQFNANAGPNSVAGSNSFADTVAVANATIRDLWQGGQLLVTGSNGNTAGNSNAASPAGIAECVDDPEWLSDWHDSHRRIG
jgi:hypothetical protein